MPGPIQTATGSSTGNTVTVTLPGNTGSGHCLVAYVGEEANTTNPTVNNIKLGGSLDNWAAAISQLNNADFSMEIWTDQSCASGQTVVVVTVNPGTGAGQNVIVRVEEWATVALTAAVDTPHVNGSNGSAASQPSGTTGALTQASNVIVAATVAGQTETGPGAPWTNQPVVNNGSIFLITGWQEVAATTAQSFTSTTSSATAFGVAIAPLKKASTGVTVNLAVAAQTFQAYPVTPVIPGITVPLATARVVFQAYPVTPKVTPELIIAIASVAGIDPIDGVSYPEGFTVFDTSNQAKYTSLLDEILTVVFPGQANIGGLFLQTEGNYSFISGQNVPGDHEAGVFVVSGTAAGLGGKSLIQLIADNVQLSGASNNIPGPAVAGFPISGAATLATTIADVNNLYQALRNLGLIQ